MQTDGKTEGPQFIVLNATKSSPQVYQNKNKGKKGDARRSKTVLSQLNDTLKYAEINGHSALCLLARDYRVPSALNTLHQTHLERWSLSLD